MKQQTVLGAAAVLASALFLSSGPGSAVPLDALEQKALEERRELMRSDRAPEELKKAQFQRDTAKKRPRPSKQPRKARSKEGVSAGGTIETNTAPDAVPVHLPAAGPAEITVQPPSADDEKGLRDRIVLDAGAADTTMAKDVRSMRYKLGLGYKVAPSHILSVEAQKEFNDPWDAAGSNRTAEAEEGMNLRYKYKF